MAQKTLHIKEKDENKTKLVYFGKQDDMNESVRQKITAKVEKAKKDQLVDFKVIRKSKLQRKLNNIRATTNSTSSSTSAEQLLNKVLNVKSENLSLPQ